MNPDLSFREQQVLRLVASSFTNGGVAKRMGIKIKTVDWYLHRINEKLGIKQGTPRVHQTRWAVKLGLISPHDKPEAV